MKNSIIKTMNASDDHDDMSEFMGNAPSTAKEFLAEVGIKYICASINQNTADDIVSWILVHNLLDKRPEELTIIITSYGGSVDHCFAITDMMKGSAIPIKTIGLGVVASCGLMIFMAGTKGRRILTPNTSILSHQFSASGGSFEKEHELIAGKKNFDLTSKKIIDHYKLHTGLTEDEIRFKLLPHSDVYLTSYEAKELNICDDIRLI